jgi:hypothetical protein
MSYIRFKGYRMTRRTFRSLYGFCKESRTFIRYCFVGEHMVDNNIERAL